MDRWWVKTGINYIKSNIRELETNNLGYLKLTLQIFKTGFQTKVCEKHVQVKFGCELCHFIVQWMWFVTDAMHFKIWITLLLVKKSSHTLIKIVPHNSKRANFVGKSYLKHVLVRYPALLRRKLFSVRRKERYRNFEECFNNAIAIHHNCHTTCK